MRMESEGGGGEDFVVELMTETEELAKVAVFDAVTFLRGRVLEKLTGNRSGRTYRVPDTLGTTYVASAPGQPPASVTGKLRQNINASRVESDGREVSAKVGVDLAVVPYARRLEFGGAHVQGGTVVRILPRPYLRPAFDENRAEAEAKMQRILDQ